MLFTLMCFSLLTMAEEKHIKIENDLYGERRHAKGIFPEISHDDAILYIYSSRALYDINIQVKNVGTGATVYEENVCIMPDEKRPFMMNIGNGQYEIYLTIGDKRWIGYFEINTANTDE